MPLIADLHHFDEEQNPDPHQVKGRIRIRIKAKKRSSPDQNLYTTIQGNLVGSVRGCTVMTVLLALRYTGTSSDVSVESDYLGLQSIYDW